MTSDNRTPPLARATNPKPSRAPSASSLKRIEGMIEHGRLEEAEAKLSPLVERFPAHSGVRLLWVELMDASRGAKAAALAAFQWAEGQPKCLGAQESLLFYAARHGHLLLANRTALRIQDLGGTLEGFPLPPAEIERILGSITGPRPTAEQMTCFDIGKLHLDAMDFGLAARWFEGLDLLPARNNRALALYHQGRIEEALTAFMSAWESDAENLFALAWAIRLRLQRGDQTGALGLCTPLAAAKARRVEDALGQLNGLLLMRQDEAAWEAFRRTSRATWFGVDEFGTAMIEHFGACAAARLGKEKDAMRLWRKALKRSPQLALAQDNLDEFARDPATLATPMVFERAMSLPMTVSEQLQADPKAALKQLTGSTSYFATLYDMGDQPLRTLVSFVLLDRATAGDLEALAAFKRFIASPAGTTQRRLKLIEMLREADLLEPDEAIRYWDGKALSELKSIATEIHREPVESGLPDALLELLGQSIEHFNAGRHARADALLAKILEQVPGHPVALGNRAAVLRGQGRAAEANALLEQVVAANPDYLMARCNLAAIAIESLDFPRAEELLAHLIERPRLHIQEYFMVVGTMAQLYAAKGELERAGELIDGLQPLVETEDDERRFEQICHRVEHYVIEHEFKKLVGQGSKTKTSRPRKKR